MGFFNKIFKKNDNVFIAYDENDLDIAKEVCEVLEYNGLSCWIKSRDLDLAGTNQIREILDAIENSGLCVVILSNNSNSSKFVTSEFNVVVDKSIPFIVFKIDDIDLDGSLKLFLNNYPFIHAYPNYKDYFPELVSKSLGLLGKNASNIRIPSHLQGETHN
jgi:hypothetical protein